jgi:HEAT repeat protein
MIAWTLGRIGNSQAKAALKKFLQDSAGKVKEEIIQAIKASGSSILSR